MDSKMINNLEAQTDCMVYQLCELMEEEIKTVEKNIITEMPMLQSHTACPLQD